jgi:hypothetical protein
MAAEQLGCSAICLIHRFNPLPRRRVLKADGLCLMLRVGFVSHVPAIAARFQHCPERL